jgi:hypothetical protein
MPKRIALTDHVEVDTTDLSDFARQVQVTMSHAQIDVSGFNPAGSNEYLAGATTESVQVDFYGSYGTGEVHQTLYPIFKGRTVVAFAWRPDGANPVGVNNPELRGNVQVFDYGPGAQRGAEDTFQVTFMAVDAAGLDFFTT